MDKTFSPIVKTFKILIQFECSDFIHRKDSAPLSKSSKTRPFYIACPERKSYKKKDHLNKIKWPTYSGMKQNKGKPFQFFFFGRRFPLQKTGDWLKGNKASPPTSKSTVFCLWIFCGPKLSVHFLLPFFFWTHVLFFFEVFLVGMFLPYDIPSLQGETLQSKIIDNKYEKVNRNRDQDWVIYEIFW